MNLHVVAYPEIAPVDYELIQSFRRDHNTLYKVIEPHFTIVFSVPDMNAEDFIGEIKKYAETVPVIRFCIRCAVINKDSFSNNYDAFLVPDEGYSNIVKLHDRLYSGMLSRYHRLDVSYIPHLSVANSPDATIIKTLVDELNEKQFVVNGVISELDVINYENRVVTTIDKVALRMV